MKEDAQPPDLYRAPALEKGLDILELLAVEQNPQSLAAVAQKLGRSKSELFRMIVVLEQRGFLVHTKPGYVLSEKLFQVGLMWPPVRKLVALARPIIRALSHACDQSCHLAVPLRGDTVVVARTESSELTGFAARVGYRQPLHLTSYGKVLWAFQPAVIRAEWEEQFQPQLSKGAIEAFRIQATTALDLGFIKQASTLNEGLQELSAPVLHGDRAAASLTVTFSRRKNAPLDVDATIGALVGSAKELSAELTQGDRRV